MNPVLSIVTPSYEQAAFVEENLRSVLEQTDALPVEHVVVDGGSTDGTVEILEEYEEEYDLRWVSEPDRGQSHALNKGIKMARGEWIGWQNSDDYYLPGAFEALDAARKRHPTVDVVYGDVLFVDEHGRPTERKYHTRPSAFVNHYGPIFSANQCSFFRASAMERIGGVDESLDVMMESELFVRLLEQGCECVHVPAFVGAFREHEDQKTHGVSDVEWNEREDVFPAWDVESYVPRLGLVGAAMILRLSYLLIDGFSPWEEPSPSRGLTAARYEAGRLVREGRRVIGGEHELFEL